MDEKSDEALLSAWNDGDANAGRSLLDRHYDAVVRFFRSKANHAVDDLVQKTFLAWSAGRQRFRGECSVRAYIFGIARHVLHEHLRAVAKTRRTDPDFDVHSIQDFEPGPSTLVFARSEQRLLVEALRRVPIEHQIILELYYWEGLGVRELAAVLGIQPGTVKSRLHRARERLERVMAEIPARELDRRSVRSQIAAWAKDVRERRPEEVDREPQTDPRP